MLVDAEGEVSVGSYAIGRLNGFAFEVDPAARHADRKMLLATAERRLGGEYEKRAAALVADTRRPFRLAHRAGQPVAILWRGHEVARLGPGKNLLSPARRCSTGGIDRVSERGREAVIARLKDWVRAGVERRSAPLRARRPCRAGSGRAAGGPRRCWRCWSTKAASSRARRWPSRSAALDREQRRAVTRLGVRIGALDLFMPAVLKPEAMRWRAALRAAAAGAAMPELPPQSSGVLPTPPDASRRCWPGSASAPPARR